MIGKVIQELGKRMEAQRKKFQEKIYQNKFKIINKMAMRTYISIITLNVNRLNAPAKRHGWLNRNENMTHIYTVYKRPSSGLEKHTDQK